MKKYGIITSLLLLGACSIGHQSGMINDDEAEVSCHARDDITSNEEVVKCIKHEAALLGKENGFTYFYVKNFTDTGRHFNVVIPGSSTYNSQTSFNADYSKSHIDGYSTTYGSGTYTPPMIGNDYMPGMKVIVKYSNSKDFGNIGNRHIYKVSMILRQQ